MRIARESSAGPGHWQRCGEESAKSLGGPVGPPAGCRRPLRDGGVARDRSDRDRGFGGQVAFACVDQGEDHDEGGGEHGRADGEGDVVAVQ